MTETIEKSKKFDADVAKVLHLVIHSLYTNKEIFLRELISNASDALDKLRYLSITNPALSQGDSDFKIKIALDDKKKTLTISDNGIGMDYDDLVNNLGTIARSGTQEFLKNLNKDEKHDAQLIGQFGVGFYSSFLVAEEVTVKTRKAGTDKTYIWHSKGDGEYTIEEAQEQANRGTEITLQIRKSEKEFLEKFRLHHVIKTYSDHISFPIELIAADGDVEVVNSASALWLKPKSEITEQQYEEFYHHSAHSYDKPWMILHNKNEGTVSYTNLLFIPSDKPFDLFHPDRKTRVNLYVKRVFITEDKLEIVPKYLRFVRGVVDSEDLPLNISRETLQNSAVLNKIRKSLVKKILSELKKKSEKAPEDYLKFWQNFGAVVKEGLCEAIDNRDEIVEICRFRTTNDPEKFTTLKEYLERMKPEQDAIYYLIGDDYKTMQNSPQLEGFKSKNIEVILLDESVDDFWTTVLHEYQGKPLKSVNRADINLDDKKEEAAKPVDDSIENLVNIISTQLGEKVKEVKVSHKLVGSPACISTPAGTLDPRMEKFLFENKQLPSRSTKVFEINPKHAAITKLAKLAGDNKDSELVQNSISALYEQALIVQGENLDNAANFSKIFGAMLESYLK